MKINNKDFWEKGDIIATQNTTTSASSFELFMYKEAKRITQPFKEIKNIKVFGCGTGREIFSIANFFNPDQIVASDISENMILRCNENLKSWKLDSITSTLVTNAKDYDNISNTYDLVSILNSMLTYVAKREDRLKILTNAYNSLKSKSVIIGTVHNQEGKPLKTLYFKVKRLFYPFKKHKVGNRQTGMKGYKVSGYYYDRKTLLEDLKVCGFHSIKIYSLEEYFEMNGKKYNRKKGYNNLFFIAIKS